MQQHRWRVHRLRDAFVDYVTEVTAASAEEARRIAEADNYQGRWHKHATYEYDDIEPGEVEQVVEIGRLPDGR